MTAEVLERTPLYDLHRSLGAKFTAFAGYEMPVQFLAGIVAEHLHTRTKAGLFDVSHMGQVRLDGPSVARSLEALVPGDIVALPQGQMRYTLFTDDGGGILDDLMVTNAGDHLFVVVNAGRKAHDIALLRSRLGLGAVTPLADRALLAVQGPAAAAVMVGLAPALGGMGFMRGIAIEIEGQACFVTRSGYTGEDGFEISVPAAGAERLARRLLASPEVMPVGLGARDTLRLEAGLCLYGHDIDQTTSLIEADLAWAVQKRRRLEGGFPGAAVIHRQLLEGVARRRVGIKPDGRAPAREKTVIVDSAGAEIGRVTSGGFSPSLGTPIAMGYVGTTQAAAGTAVGLVVRGTTHPAHIVPLPFVPHRYYRG